MPKSTITPEEAAELKVVQQAYLDAHRRAADAIRTEGMDSEAFFKADAEMGAAVKRWREILGLPNHWMG